MLVRHRHLLGAPGQGLVWRGDFGGLHEVEHESSPDEKWTGLTGLKTGFTGLKIQNQNNNPVNPEKSC
jgi:hypothetical protein